MWPTSCSAPVPAASAPRSGSTALDERERNRAGAGQDSPRRYRERRAVGPPYRYLGRHRQALAPRRGGLAPPVPAVPGAGGRMSGGSAQALADRAVDVVPPDGLAAKLALGRPLRVKLGVDPDRSRHPSRSHRGPAEAARVPGRRSHRGADHRRLDRPRRRPVRPHRRRGRCCPPSRSTRTPRPTASRRSRILDPERIEIRSNGEWFAGMGLEPLFRLAATATVNQLLRRNDFAERMSEPTGPISVLELLYPLMQAYDSVAVRGRRRARRHRPALQPDARPRDPGRPTGSRRRSS